MKRSNRKPSVQKRDLDEIDDTDRPTLLVHKEERLYDATRAERTNLQFFDSCHKSPLIGLEGFGREESKVELG